MKDRFKKQKNDTAISLLFPILCFVVVMGLFFYGMSQVSGGTDAAEAEALETIINRDVVHCYAAKGVYPPSLEYLVENYGLVYDSDKYEIDYKPLGESILPEINVRVK